MTPQQIRQYFDSNEFRDANEDKRREIRSKWARRWRQGWKTRQMSMPRCALMQKTVYLDKIIDEMQARRAEFRGKRRQRCQWPA